MTKKRERRGAAGWQQLLEEQRASGETMTGFARTRGIALGSLYHWKKQLEGDQSSKLASKKSAFSEVVVVPRAAAVARVEVIARSGRAVRIEGAFDASLLREVLRVVESC